MLSVMYSRWLILVDFQSLMDMLRCVKNFVMLKLFEVFFCEIQIFVFITDPSFSFNQSHVNIGEPTNHKLILA